MNGACVQCKKRLPAGMSLCSVCRLAAVVKRTGKLSLVLVLMFGYGSVRGQEQPRKSDRQLIYDLEMRVLALEQEAKRLHGDPSRPIYKPKVGDREGQ
jgi:hypothetical protein